MLTGFLIIAVIALLGVLTHRQNRFQTRVLKNVPLADWMTIAIIPFFMYLGWFIIVRQIADRPRISLFILDDIDNLILTTLFLSYGFAANGVHFMAKIISRYLTASRKSTIYQVNEMFHGKLTHYVTYLSAFFTVFMTALFEVNHPLEYPMLEHYMFLIALLAFIMGLSVRKSVFFTHEWFGGFNKPIIFVVGAQLFIQYLIMRSLELSLYYYPMFFFVLLVNLSFITAFIVRQILIFAKLNQKRRLRFLNKIFSV